jgi:hypothetical protein
MPRPGSRNGPGLRICNAAIYTQRVKSSHVIRTAILRQIAIVNYVNPF